MNQIHLVDSSNIKLIKNHKLFPFLFFTIKSQAYLLTRAHRNRLVQRHIFFTQNNKQYYSTFLRHINLSYCGKLCEILQCLEKNVKNVLYKQWFMLYEVHDFTPSQKMLYKVHEPVYGQQVLIGDEANGQISNLFKYGGQLIYFLSCQNKPLQQIYFRPIIKLSDTNQKLIYGVCLNINDISICFPFQSIFSQQSPKLSISEKILPYLFNTCYISFKTIKFCTGIRINQNMIISTGHLIPIQERQIGAKVLIRFYPYKEQIEGMVTKIGVQGLDYIEINTKISSQKLQFLDNVKNEERANESNRVFRLSKILLSHHISAKKSLKRLKKNNEMKKQTSLKVNLNSILHENKLPKINYQDIEHYFKQDFDKRLNYLNIGGQITDVGFGKLPFSSNLFYRLQIVLPTVVSGTISKIININEERVFIKTGISLYNGSSGSGLWSDGCLLGMVLFLFKLSRFHHSVHQHNFSYCVDFLRNQYLNVNNEIFKDMNLKAQSLSKNIGYMKPHISQQLLKADQVQNRNQMKLLKKSKM